jgi:hypothetical protein
VSSAASSAGLNVVVVDVEVLGSLEQADSNEARTAPQIAKRSGRETHEGGSNTHLL